MEIPKSDWERYIEKLSAINKKAADMMRAWIETNGYDSIEALIYWANGLTQKYGEAAAALACEMYDNIAAASDVVVPAAVPANVVPERYVAKAVRETLDKSPTTVPNVVGRMVKQAGADTTLQNAQRDGAQFAWIPSGDTCAFCITLASRGWQNISKKALKNGHAEHIHSNCNCEYAVRFDEKSGVAGYDPEKYEDMYYGAEGNTSQEKINSLRRANYAENKDKINEQKRIAYAKREDRKNKNNATSKINNNSEKSVENEEPIVYNNSSNGSVMTTDEFHQIINGTVTVDGITIESSVHLYEQAIKRNVSPNAIVDSLTNPLKTNPIKYDEIGRPSKQYIGEQATTAVNPETGKATTCTKTHSKIVKRLKGGQ